MYASCHHKFIGFASLGDWGYNIPKYVQSSQTNCNQSWESWRPISRFYTRSRLLLMSAWILMFSRFTYRVDYASPSHVKTVTLPQTDHPNTITHKHCDHCWHSTALWGRPLGPIVNVVVLPFRSARCRIRTTCDDFTCAPNAAVLNNRSLLSLWNR